MESMGKATLLLTLLVVFLSSPLLAVASRSSFDAGKKTAAAHTNLSEVGGEEGKAAAAVDGSMQRVDNAGASQGRNPPSATAASARQVPTGPDPIHHHQSPIRH